jgi:hypothetical protein
MLVLPVSASDDLNMAVLAVSPQPLRKGKKYNRSKAGNLVNHKFQDTELHQDELTVTPPTKPTEHDDRK